MEHEKRKEIITSLFQEGYSHKQVCKILKFDSVWLTKYCYAHKIKTVRYDILNIPKDLKQIMLGSLLGDGHISKPNGKNGACYYQERHGSKQKDYSEWKFENLGEFKRTINVHFKFVKFPNGSSGTYEFIDIRSISHPLFTELRNEWYPNGKKTVPESVTELDPLGLAVWYMDDGSYSSKTFKFYTNSFSKEENQFLSDLLNEKFQIQTSVQSFVRTKKENHILVVKAVSRNRFVEVTEPYLLNSFKYKLGPFKTL